MLIAIAASVLARAVTVVCCSAGSTLLGRRISLPWQGVMIWGGLRGAVAIALVLALPDSLSWWYTVQSMVFGVVLFSLLVQFTSLGPLLKRLRL
jgi:CPA1 family monovalent cation:H+ antiporter